MNTECVGEAKDGGWWAGVYLDAMKGVMSNSRGKETYVVIFLRSLAECSNRWGWPEREDERGERGLESGGEGAGNMARRSKRE